MSRRMHRVHEMQRHVRVAIVALEIANSAASFRRRNPRPVRAWAPTKHRCYRPSGWPPCARCASEVEAL